MVKKRRLLDEYQFPGVRPRSAIQGMFGDPKARIIRLERSEKKRPVAFAGLCIGATTTRRDAGYGTCPAGMPGYTWRWRFGASGARGAGQGRGSNCRGWRASRFCTNSFAYVVG